MFPTIEDVRIQWTTVVLPPVFLEEERPTSDAAIGHHLQYPHSRLRASSPSATTALARPRRPLLHSRHQSRTRIRSPCWNPRSLNSPQDLRIVMRVYFEKPRTTMGWKGLINDPHLDGSYKINDGLRIARHLLLDLAEMGVPTGTEFLDMISPQYIAGLVAGEPSARAPPRARCIASSSPAFPAPWASKTPPRATCRWLSTPCSPPRTRTPSSATPNTASLPSSSPTGNPDCHIILRGGRKSVNYTADCVAETGDQMEKRGDRATHHD
jgi:3-deoxy-7-phosphoheptulonate synthase